MYQVPVQVVNFQIIHAVVVKGHSDVSCRCGEAMSIIRIPEFHLLGVGVGCGKDDNTSRLQMLLAVLYQQIKFLSVFEMFNNVGCIDDVKFPTEIGKSRCAALITRGDFQLSENQAVSVKSAVIYFILK